MVSDNTTAIILSGLQKALSGGFFWECHGGHTFSHVGIFSSSAYKIHVSAIFIDALLILTFIVNLFSRLCSRHSRFNQGFHFSSALQVCSAAFNGCLGLVYLGSGLWMLVDRNNSSYSLDLLLVQFTHGFTVLLFVATVWITARRFGNIFTRLWSVVACLLNGFICISSLLDIIVANRTSLKIILDILCLPGAILLLVCVFKNSKEAQHQPTSSSLYAPLNSKAAEPTIDADRLVTPYASAGVFSRISFWWLNLLLKKGYQKPLEEKDIPQLSEVDRAEFCHSLFLEQLCKKKKAKPDANPSYLWAIVSCYRSEILLTGLFALVKILTLSLGPVILNAFIKVSSGLAAYRYEGYVLALALFVTKCIESLSQRQWYFRSRLLGLKVKSILSAAVYQKQLRLSNVAKLMHSSGEIMNYVNVDAYRIGEFPYWFHQTWTTILQLFLALVILVNAVRSATIATMVVIVLTVLVNVPVAKLQHKYQTKLMGAQDSRLKAMAEALVSMKVLKLYAWETHFKKVIEGLRTDECEWLSAFQRLRAYNSFIFWSSPVLVSVVTFSACYLLNIPLSASNVFTFVATLRLIQDPIRSIPDVIAAVIQSNVAFTRIVNFLEAPELHNEHVRKRIDGPGGYQIAFGSASFSWDGNSSKPNLKNINLKVRAGDKVAVCGEVGSGKSTLLAAILGEIPCTKGTIHVCGRTAYVSQTAWIQTGSLRDNILFGCPMDNQKYQVTLERCSLVKDIEMLPFGDLTEIGERGVNLSGGQKQRVQLARALYQDADIYLLDDPFSAVDAHTATSLFNDYVLRALSAKTVILVTHQVDFLPVFNSILLMSDGEVIHAASYKVLIDSSKEFQDLVNAHKDTVGPRKHTGSASPEKNKTNTEILYVNNSKENELPKESALEQLIKKEEREIGDTGFKPYLRYLNQNKGILYASLSVLSHMIFIAGQISQNSWMAAKVEDPDVSKLKLIMVYLVIGLSTSIFLFTRSMFIVVLGMEASKSLFSQLLSSLFRAPMAFFDSTPLGRMLSRVSSDLSIVDVDVPFMMILSCSATLNAYSNLGVLAVVTWEVIFIAFPVVYLSIQLQRYYLASAKELMRINGTTRSVVTNHLAESLAGAITIRAFEEEDRFFSKNLELIDKNASPFFHNFAVSEWLIQRLETMSALVLSSSALVMTLLPQGTFSSGFVGMALSYGLSLNLSLVFSVQNQCTLANNIISVERLNQYMHIPSEAPEVIHSNRPEPSWPSIGRVELQNLKIRYRPNTPLVLRGISCTFEGGHNIGIVGRTGSGKTTLIGALFRLVEPAGGKILIDDVDISTIGLHDLRSRLGIIPQDPTLFHGSVRYNLDPLGHHTDHEIWEVLDKCQLRDVVQEKDQGLDSLIVEDGSNWSMGQRQLLCLGRALLRRSHILVLDEATASIDNATDAILQKTIRAEFADCTVITVAHRIPTVMDCTMVLAISDGRLMEYDEPTKLMKTEGSLFRELVKEYWSNAANPDPKNSHST